MHCVKYVLSMYGVNAHSAVCLGWLAFAAAGPAGKGPFAVPPDQQPHQTLDGIHKRLSKAPPRRVAVKHGVLQLGAMQPQPGVLLGIMSGSAARRNIARCTWLRSIGTGSHIRTLFVVGEKGHTMRVISDILYVDVAERQRMWKAKEQLAINETAPETMTGTFTTYLKQVEFLRYAADQPEPFVARADDDVFISPLMLQAYTAVLAQLNRSVYLGVFEWYSWKTRALSSTGFGFSCKAANSRARAPWRNCSQVSSASSPVLHHCIGPFAFAKGPFLLLSTDAVHRVVHSSTFAQDVQRSRDLVAGKVEKGFNRPRGRIDDDVHLAYWLSQLPGLYTVRVRRQVWHEQGAHWGGASLSYFLASHKFPWPLYSTMCEELHRAWSGANEVNVQMSCSDEPPCDSKISSHHSTQGTCILEVALGTDSNAPMCDRTGPRKCPFSKTIPPTSAQCWKHTPMLPAEPALAPLNASKSPWRRIGMRRRQHAFG